MWSTAILLYCNATRLFIIFSSLQNELTCKSIIIFKFFFFKVVMTKCTNVCIDMFCFYAKISCRSHIIKSESAKVKIDDFSDGRETCPVVLINEISEDLPPHLAYISSRNKAEDVYINIDPGFLVCCDCTDFCQVRKLGLTFHSYFQNHLERCQKLISHD